jgi:hypothetical protein
VKQILARFTMTALILASMVLTLGAGIRWGVSAAAQVVGVELDW